MNVFLSYASEDRDLADQVHLALRGDDHEVFFDRDSLPAGGDYHARIRAAVEQADVFVFLVSRHSTAAGSYALTELRHARAKWPHPKGRVLPVRVDDVPWEAVPTYLKAVTVLEPEGNAPAEIVIAVATLRDSLEGTSSPGEAIGHERPSAHARWGRVAALAGTGAALLVATAYFVHDDDSAGAASPTSSAAAPSRSDSPDRAPETTSDATVPGPTVTGTAASEEPRTPTGTDTSDDDTVEVIEVPLDKRPLALTMIHEIGRPRSYTSVLAMGDDLWYGQGFHSLERGSLHELVQQYVATPTARFATALSEYLPQLERRDAQLLGDERFKALLARAAGEDPIMVRLQDQVVEDRFLGPARAEAAAIGIETALGFALIADTMFNVGRVRYERIKLSTIRALDGTPVTGVSEPRWLRRFAEERAADAPAIAAASIERRTRLYLDLMAADRWDLSAPLDVGRYTLVDP